MSTRPNNLPEDVIELVDRAIHGQLSEQDRIVFSRQLSEDQTVCEYYTTMMSLHARLSLVYGQQPVVSDLQSLTLKKTTPRPHSHSRRVAWGVGLCAALIIGVLLSSLGNPWKNVPRPQNELVGAPNNPQNIGTLSLHHEGENDSQAGSVVQPVVYGEELELTEAVVISLESGVEIHVNGPARLKLFPMKCELIRGKIVARVSPEGEGFRVVTRNSSIVDYGTEFGVSVDEQGQSAIAVFEGQIGVFSSRSDDQRNMHQGEGLDVDSQGNFHRLLVVNDETFDAPSQENRADQLITSVTDNIRDPDMLNYYRIKSGGIQEDAPIYVDRKHQFNSIRNDTIPEYLKTGELVMTFNDDKANDTYEMTLTLARDAELFVMFDARVEPPEWLSQDFVEQQERVGVDEDSVTGGYQTTATGPGSSVDNAFRIWSRKVTAGEVILGHLGGNTERRSMYSVLARSLEP